MRSGEQLPRRKPQKLSISGWCTFAQAMRDVVQHPDFDAKDERNKQTVDTHHRMAAEGAFGNREQRREWAKGCRERGGA